MVVAYHFTGAKLRDGRPVPQIGEELRHDGEIVWGRSGLYACPTPYDAYLYMTLSQGNVLNEVECEEIYEKYPTQFVCRSRTILKSFDASVLIRKFAAQQALDFSPLWAMPQVTLDYLMSLDENNRLPACGFAHAEIVRMISRNETPAEIAAANIALAATNESPKRISQSLMGLLPMPMCRDEFNKLVANEFQES